VVTEFMISRQKSEWLQYQYACSSNDTLGERSAQRDQNMLTPAQRDQNMLTPAQRDQNMLTPARRDHGPHFE
jgi:hypothetical protein